MERPVILAVGPLDGPLKRIESVLQRSTLDVHQAPGGWTALSLARSTSPHLLIAGLPLSDMPTADFLQRLRNGMDAFSRTRVVLLANQEEQAGLEQYLDERHILLSVDRGGEELEQRILEFLGTTSRAANRLMLRLEVLMGAGKVLRAFQSENVSETGILVHTDEPFAVGLEVRLEITLPNEPVPVRVKAEIVRHADPDKESVPGLGIRFTQFEGKGRELLKRYLRSQEPVD